MAGDSSHASARQEASGTRFATYQSTFSQVTIHVSRLPGIVGHITQ
jgi:hypothetical protein